ncbi:hypothetical protein DXG03_000074 [Asterophora parasitica]|uniref:Cell division control protein 14 n=1 Tax=Asterophora parasitica TaxID=117018 RepID=A0A9P7GKL3_9AGAR|nr:hypothetical protein DXG03_000074 [Asterophora parasitica]
MNESLHEMRDSLQDALDELSSTHSSSEAKSRALHRIEKHLALACFSKESSENLHRFNALQYTFECNVPSRLLAWISNSTSTLEALTNKGSMDHERESQASRLAAQLSLSLSLIQGVALNHSASKSFLGRKYALEASPGRPPVGFSPSSDLLVAYVLDTLLCILVDSNTALRAFEESHGVQAVVKILKRAGTPREVRMKCLEFLYFYLLDENPAPDAVNSPSYLDPPTAPTSPVKSSKSFISSDRPMRPSSRFGSGFSEFSFSSIAASSSMGSVPGRTTSGSSSASFSSTSSVTSVSTPTSSISSSPDKISSMPPPKTPPSSPPPSYRVPQQLQPRSLMMLRREIDYEPQSPKKAQVSRLGAGGSRHTPGSGSISRSRLASEDDCQRYSQVPATPSRRSHNSRAEEPEPSKAQSANKNLRTTEEKKELLGTMLGNVDALVEGVRKAGIWGLG